MQDAEYFRDAFNAVQTLVNEGLILAGHDISAGGLIPTLLEMTFANTTGGLDIHLDKMQADDLVKILFSENPGVVIQVADKDCSKVKKMLEDMGIGYVNIGHPCEERTLSITREGETTVLDIDRMRAEWYRSSHLMDTKQT